ncbi:MLO-like protein 6 [Linum grandiflorum]
MADKANMERTLEETPTWAVAAVCFVLVVISIFIEHIIHLLHKWLHKLHKPALVEALEKVKAELMLLGFLSLLLTVFQSPISSICVSREIGGTWHPCTKKEEKASDDSGENRRRLLGFLDPDMMIPRRSLATKGVDKCTEQGKVAFVSAYGIHQLHIFIFVLAFFHILYCIITYILGRTKMRKWRQWEDETKTLEYQYHNDPERFRFARDTSFGRRHLKMWSKSTILLWIVSFFRQFFRSVTKVDYMTLRHGFIAAHLAPGSESRFDFQKYVNRSLEDDFKVVVGISPILWFFAVLFLLSNTHGWLAYLWLPFIPLIIILVVGTKLQVIITQLGLSIMDKSAVVKGAPVVQPGDDLFWFGRPRLILFLIHFCLFQNAFQLAFFIWSVYEFGIKTCFHEKTEDIVIRITMGVIIQVLCSYVVLPLYALVTQMGSNMRPTIFNDRVASALKNWHRTARRQTRHGGSHTPTSSRPATPTHGMSPVHLLQNYRSSTAPDSLMNSPARNSNFDNDHWDPEALNSPVHHHYSSHGGGGHRELEEFHDHNEFHHDASLRDQPGEDEDVVVAVRNQELRGASASSETMQLPPGPGSIRTQHEMNIGLSDFTFR